MENINFDIACDVSNCKHNYNGCNCTLEKICVGCTHSDKNFTCCESYTEKF